MKLERVAFRPMAILNFSVEEIAALMQCSAIHYDHHCRSASEVGGFLYGMKVRATTGRPSSTCAPHTLSSDQIDTLRKILEMPAEGTMPIRQELTRELGRVFGILNNLALLELRER